MPDQVELWMVKESQANTIRGEISVASDKDKLHDLENEETLVELYTQNVIQLCSSGKLSKDPLFRKKFNKYLQGKK